MGASTYSSEVLSIIIIVVQSLAGHSSCLTHFIRCEAKSTKWAQALVFQTAEDGEEGRFLPSGADQDGLGGPGEISEPPSCWSRSLRTGLFCHRHRAEISRWLRGRLLWPEIRSSYHFTSHHDLIIIIIIHQYLYLVAFRFELPSKSWPDHSSLKYTLNGRTER